MGSGGQHGLLFLLGGDLLRAIGARLQHRGLVGQYVDRLVGQLAIFAGPAIKIDVVANLRLRENLVGLAQHVHVTLHHRRAGATLRFGDHGVEIDVERNALQAVGSGRDQAAAVGNVEGVQNVLLEALGHVLDHRAELLQALAAAFGDLHLVARLHAFHVGHHLKYVVEEPALDPLLDLFDQLAHLEDLGLDLIDRFHAFRDVL